MECRICKSRKVGLLEKVSFYTDFSAEVFFCEDCKSRFSSSYEEYYQDLHDTDYGYYSPLMQSKLDKAKTLFDARDVAGLRKQLDVFHIAAGQVVSEARAMSARSVMEIGCAWGYVGSYFILDGYDYLGVDVSDIAVAKASAAFGDHFSTIQDERYLNAKDLDVIFHLGTIGCIDDPLDFTRFLLSKLRPGGVLVFNSPSTRPCEQLDIPWIFGACPPALVTLFSETFWQEQFADECDVSTRVVNTDALNSFLWRRQRRRGQRQPDRGTLRKPEASAQSASRMLDDNTRASIRQVLSGVMSPFVKPVADNFGVIVTMRKKA